MKVELYKDGDDYLELLKDAYEFMSDMLPVKRVQTEYGWDLCSLYDIELGSYGARTFENFTWSYGTGLALPRTTNVLN